MDETNEAHAAELRAGGIPEDIERCADIWVRALRARDGKVDAEVMAQRVREAFRGPIVRFAVATRPRPGFALVESLPERPGAALLHYLAVDPDRQGRGVGRALLEDAAHHAARAGFSVLVLEVRTANERAIALYERFGFVPFGAPVPHPAAGYPMQSYELRLT